MIVVLIMLVNVHMVCGCFVPARRALMIFSSSWYVWCALVRENARGLRLLEVLWGARVCGVPVGVWV